MPDLMRRLGKLRPRLPRPIDGFRVVTADVEGFFNATFFAAPSAEDSRLRLIARRRYYEVNARGYAIDSGRHEHTTNHLVTIDRGMSPGARARTLHLPVLDGLEDVRVHAAAQGRLLFTAADPFVALRGGAAARLRTAQVLGRLEVDGDSLHASFAPVVDRVGCIEKNWVLFDDGGSTWIERYPMAPAHDRVVVEGDAARVEPGGVAPAPLRWSGTRCVRFDGGLLFIDHRRVYVPCGMRMVSRYAYRLRLHAGRGAPARLSREFGLGDVDRLTYLHDAVVDGNELLLSIGIDDGAIRLASVPLSSVRQMIARGTAPVRAAPPPARASATAAGTTATAADRFTG